MAFKGTGVFNRTLEFVGYGFIPQIFGSLVTLIMAVYYLPMIQVPVVNSFQDPVVIQNAVYSPDARFGNDGIHESKCGNRNNLPYLECEYLDSRD